MLIEDKSKKKIFTKVRRIGHFISILPIVSLIIYLSSSSGTLNILKCATLAFLLFGWYVVIPFTLLIGNPNFLSLPNNRIGQITNGLLTIQQQLLYYLWPIVVIILFIILTLTPWSKPLSLLGL